MSSMRLLLALFLVSVPPAGALLPSYKPERMRDLQAQGRVILLQFTSQTCALCRQQEEALERLAKDSSKAAPVILQVDYDSEEGLRQLWRISAPSTIVIFRGMDLLDRKTGLVSEEDVRAFLRDSVARSRGRPRPRTPAVVRPKR